METDIPVKGKKLYVGLLVALSDARFPHGWPCGINPAKELKKHIGGGIPCPCGNPQHWLVKFQEEVGGE